MKKLITILFICLLPLFSKAQTANAGSDKLVYLTQGNSVYIGGSSSGDSYLWTALTDSVPRSTTGITNPATIITPTAQKTLVRGLTQGAWPYQIAVTTGSTTVYDTVIVRVAYSPAPLNSTKLDSISTSASFNSLAKPSTVQGYTVAGFNDRTDTTSYFGVGGGSSQYWRANWNNNTSYKFANDQTAFWIPPTNSTLFGLSHDGTNAGDGYIRTQISMGSTGCPEGNMDSSHIYLMEQQMYFTKNPSVYFKDNQHDVLFGFDMHGHSTANPFSLSMTYPNKIFVQDASASGTNTEIFPTSQITTDSLTNKVHTFRLYQKLGKKGFIKVFYDGILLYQRSGDVGDSYNDDYSDNWPQWGGLYDHSAEIVDYTNATRKNSLNIGTTAWRFYSLSDTAQFTQAGHPTTSISDQTISGSSTSISTTASAGSGASISSYSWEVISGSATIVSPTSATTDLTGVTDGTIIRNYVTQDDGQIAYSDAVLTVETADPPTISLSGDQTIIVDHTTLFATPVWASGHSGTVLWTKISGPGTTTIGSPTANSTTVSGLQTGTYVFRVTVTQDDGQTTYSEITVTVNLPVTPPQSVNVFIFGTPRIFINKN
jgi:hypothetical protein